MPLTIDRNYLIQTYGDELHELNEITLINKRITAIDTFTFRDLSNLTELYLRNNHLTHLDADLFKNLSSLTNLSLSSNQISQLDVNLFKNLRNLTFLSLAQNQIEQLDSNIFENISSLTVLDLSYNKITQLHSDIFKNLLNLNELYLSHNRISHLDSDLFRNLAKLSKLFLWENKLTHLDVNLFRNLLNLTNLYLYDNQLDKLDPDIFKHLSNLTLLYLPINQLVHLHFNIFRNFPHLKSLDLSRNKLKHLESNLFESLFNLSELNLSANQLTKLEPDLFKTLSKLTELRLHANQLVSINRKCFDRLNKNSLIAVISLFSNTTKFKSFAKDINKVFVNKFELIENECVSNFNEFLYENQFEGKIELINDQYIIVKELGKGATSEVNLVYDKKNNNDKALKIVSVLGNEYRHAFFNELKLLKKHDDSEFIIKYFDHFMPDTRFANCYIVIEYFPNGDLGKRIRASKEAGKQFKESQIISWMTQATKGLQFLHSKNIIHRDIKPENMFLTETDEIKLGDLGFARPHDHTSIITTFIGTYPYISPEVFDRNYSFSTDIWSIGCVLYEMITFELAFPKGPNVDTPKPDLGNSRFQSILQRMLQRNYGDRIEVDEILERLDILAKTTVESESHIGMILTNRYKIFNKLDSNRGHYQVYQVSDHIDNITKTLKTNQDYNEEEIESLKRLDSQFIIKLFDYFIDSIFSMCLITEYFENGTLARRIEKTRIEEKTFHENVILDWVIQATQGLKYLHSNNIIHRDIRPDNIFLTEHDEIKLGYLGSCKSLQVSKSSEKTILPITSKNWGEIESIEFDQSSNSTSSNLNFTASIKYTSPEVWEGDYTFTTDNWSLGCVIYELLFLKVAFPKGCFVSTLRPDLGDSFIFSTILEKLLNKDWKKRMNSNDLYDRLMRINAIKN